MAGAPLIRRDLIRTATTAALLRASATAAVLMLISLVAHFSDDVKGGAGVHTLLLKLPTMPSRVGILRLLARLCRPPYLGLEGWWTLCPGIEGAEADVGPR